MRVVEQYIREHPEQFVANYHAREVLGRLEIEVRLDWRCNAKCKFCGVWKYSRDGMLPRERWFQIFTELAGQGLAHVLFTGGEPMLYPDFFEIIEHVDGLGVNTAIITNGSLLDAGRVRRLAALKGLREITVSLDSPDAKVHDEVRVMRGLFKRATEGMARVRELAPSVKLTVNTVVSAATAGTVKDLFTLPVLPDQLQVFPVGLDFAWLDSLAGIEENDWGSWAEQAKTEDLPREALVRVRQDIEGLRAEAERLGVDLVFERVDHEGVFAGVCVVPMGHFVIQPDGDVYPCCHVQDKPNRIGKLAEQSPAEMFAGDTYRDFLTQVRPPTLPACASCSRYRGFNEQANTLLSLDTSRLSGRGGR